MNIETVVSKIGRYLHRDLKYLMRETDTLQKMKSDLLELEALLKQAYESKDAEILAKYHKKRVKKENRLAERLERRLDIFLKRLEDLLALEKPYITGNEIDQIELLKEQIKVSQSNLARILSWKGELHNLIEEDKDWSIIETKIEEALGNDQQPGIRSLIATLEALEQLEESLHTGEQSAKEIAEQKLKLLLSNFTDFGIRFVNKGEFFAVMNNQLLPVGREIYMSDEPFLDILKNVTSPDWLKEGGLLYGWSYRVGFQTDWDAGRKSVEINRMIILCMKEAKAAAGSDRKKFFQLLRQGLYNALGGPFSYSRLVSLLKSLQDPEVIEKIKGFRKSIGPYGGEIWMHERMISDEVGWSEKDNLEDLGKAIQNFGKQNLLLLSEYWKDPEWLEKKKNLQLFIRFCISRATSDEAAYQVALIIRGPFETHYEHGWEFPKWKRIGGDNKAGTRLLAAFLIVQDVPLLKQMVATSQTAGEFSCPIINYTGMVQYPKKVRLVR